ncbi:MAG TPA: nucleotidyl transferase AbiEii/AbiGii toxin family protein [Sphaerochaeta sp.]|jgi:predicted nucleotidyltransferase component of viral defense system|nr:nucleotidyl transferase AbiEii/AbiGii toxin family protein [Sphaerochaeta sp.]
MNIVESTKAKLKNRALKNNRSYNEVITVYGLERMLYRLSISHYKEHFVLKGGILLYALFEGNYMRGTADVDFLGHNISNTTDEMKTVFKEVFSIECPKDGIRFDLDSLRAIYIAEFKKYAGINISIDGYLGRTKLRVTIDIGFGDVIFPSSILMEYPTLLDQERPMILAYTIESVISEKFEAIISLGKANSRMKDFYDIYVLSRSMDFGGEKLKTAIGETLDNRKTNLDSIVAFELGFSDNPHRKGQWTSFIRAKKVDSTLSLPEVIDQIEMFLHPIVEALRGKTNFQKIWNSSLCLWETIE